MGVFRFIRDAFTQDLSERRYVRGSHGQMSTRRSRPSTRRTTSVGDSSRPVRKNHSVRRTCELPEESFREPTSRGKSLYSEVWSSPDGKIQYVTKRTEDYDPFQPYMSGNIGVHESERRTRHRWEDQRDPERYQSIKRAGTSGYKIELRTPLGHPSSPTGTACPHPPTRHSTNDGRLRLHTHIGDDQQTSSRSDPSDSYRIKISVVSKLGQFRPLDLKYTIAGSRLDPDPERWASSIGSANEVRRAFGDLKFERQYEISKAIYFKLMEAHSDFQEGWTSFETACPV
jgi:hypothetical protein